MSKVKKNVVTVLWTATLACCIFRQLQLSRATFQGQPLWTLFQGQPLSMGFQCEPLKISLNLNLTGMMLAIVYFSFRKIKKHSNDEQHFMHSFNQLSTPFVILFDEIPFLEAKENLLLMITFEILTRYICIQNLMMIGHRVRSVTALLRDRQNSEAFIFTV